MAKMLRQSPKRQPARRRGFVFLKTGEQRDTQTLHRVRNRLVDERTSLTNQSCAISLERGIIVPQGHAKLRVQVTALLAQHTGELSLRLHLLVDS